MIAESVSYMIQQICSHLQKCFLPIKVSRLKLFSPQQSRLESGKKYSDAKLDVLAAVTLALQMLHGSATRERKIILKLCMHVIFQIV